MHGIGRVLVVEDDYCIRHAVMAALSAQGYETDAAADGSSALDLARREPPDLVVLDLGLPDMDGTRVIEHLRTWSCLPILVLSVRNEEVEKVRALDLGADDYLTKPFGTAELLARVRAALRRARSSAQSRIVATPAFAIDLAAKRVHAADGTEIRLTPTEWGILEVLACEAGKLVSQRTILQEVWGPAFLNETHYLRIYMGQLRRKLEPEPGRPRYLITEPGRGYRLEAERSSQPDGSSANSR